MRSIRGVAWSCGLISYVLSASPSFAESDSKTVQVSATILPRLELSVSPETGEGIVFGAIEQPAPGSEASRSVSVHLNVFSNLGHPYQVTQAIRRPLTNADGQRIPERQFRVSTRDAGLGVLGVEHPTPLTPGVPTTLYTSNERGKSDRFSADYTLTVTPETPAGDFGTEILYTVTSL